MYAVKFYISFLKSTGKHKKIPLRERKRIVQSSAVTVQSIPRDFGSYLPVPTKRQVSWLVNPRARPPSRLCVSGFPALRSLLTVTSSHRFRTCFPFTPRARIGSAAAPFCFPIQLLCTALRKALHPPHWLVNKIPRKRIPVKMIFLFLGESGMRSRGTAEGYPLRSFPEKRKEVIEMVILYSGRRFWRFRPCAGRARSPRRTGIRTRSPG